MKKTFLVIVLFLSEITFAQSHLENLSSRINSKNSELRPVISADGNVLYFVVEKNNSGSTSKKSKNKIQEVWFSSLNADGSWGQAEICSDPLNHNGKDNAVFWSSSDGSQILIRGAYVDGKYQGRGFSFCKKSEKGWSQPVALNIKGYQNLSVDIHDGACLSLDGKTMLLYLSEEKNSWLNDIYVSKLENDNSWSVPQKIISDSVSIDDYDEIAPYLAADGITMYFSSDRPGGKGSYDIWMTKRLDDSWLQWSKPVNVGDSVNSNQWEAYFTLDAKAEYGYLASTRNSIGEIDLCKIKLSENQKPNSVTFLQGKVYNASNNEIINDVEITSEIEGSNNPLKIELQNQVFKTILPYGKKYIITAKREGFQSSSQVIDLSNLAPYQEMHKDLFLIPVNLEKKDSIISNDSASNNQNQSVNIPVAENKNNYQEEKITSKNNSKKEKKKNNTDVVSKSEISVQPKEKKQNNKEKSLVKKSENKIQNQQNNADVSESNENNEKISNGDLISINNLLFDFAQSDLKMSSCQELNKVVNMMQENEKITIELSAHTDNIGSEEYNLTLSRARAKSSKKYLVSKGISSKRISTKGYGETNPIANNKTASGRKQNRRVEVKILSGN